MELKKSVFIDATNLVDGGGVTHIRELLNATRLQKQGDSYVYICAFQFVLDQIERKDWLIKVPISKKYNSTVGRLIFRLFLLRRKVSKSDCDILFAPGGNLSKFRGRKVTMCRNMLPFEPQYWRDAGLLAVRYIILRAIQIRSFRKASGVIFLSQHAVDKVRPIIGSKPSAAIIPHGVQGVPVGPVGACEVRAAHQSDVKKTKVRFLYVSPVAFYKNHSNVLDALLRLRKEGHDVVIDLVGGCSARSHRKLKSMVEAAGMQPKDVFTMYGILSRQEVAKRLNAADCFVFASNCENFPNTLVEGMAAGLPIICSDLRPMTDILQDAGLYFNPKSADSIYESMRKMLMLSHSERWSRFGCRSLELASAYKWEDCAVKTWQYLLCDRHVQG